MHPLRPGALLLVLLLSSSLASAGSFNVPPDRDLIRAADAAAMVTILSHRSYYAPGGVILTDHRALVTEVAKGEVEPGATIVITEIGGVVGAIAMGTSTAPRFDDGESALVMLEARGEGWTTHEGLLGKFELVRDATHATFLIRDVAGDIAGGDDAQIESARDAAAFLSFVRAVARGETPAEDYVRETAGELVPPASGEGAVGILSTFPGNAFLTQLDFPAPNPDGGARWGTGNLSMKKYGSQTGSDTAATTAADAWNGDSGSSIGISISGTSASLDYGDDNDTSQQVINFGVPDGFATVIGGVSVKPLAGSPIAQSFYVASSGTTTNAATGEQFYMMTSCDIIIEDSLTGKKLEEVVAHEMGHCLGFRHSEAGTPSSSSALMRTNPTGQGAILRDWDKEGANQVYGSGALYCDPKIITQPKSTTIQSGQTATLSVTATGVSSYQYQWYQGGAPATGTPIGGATTSTYTTPALTATQSYSVRVSSTCGFADSTVATVSISCAPTITTQPKSTTVSPGTSATLTVVAKDATSYQWYRGSSGNTSQPVAGATSATLVTESLQASASFWVKVGNSCGSTNSSTATVTVCNLPSITAQPQSVTIAFGQAATLSIGVTNATSIQWYRGIAGDTAAPIVGATSASLNTGALTVTTQFWARAGNSCGSVDSATATVTVPSPCDPPAVQTQPASTSILYGASATLNVAATGTDLQYQWYEGPSGDLGRPVTGATTASFTTPPLTTATQYWVYVSNACGSASSGAASVTISPGVVVSALPDALLQVAGSSGATASVTLSNRGGTATTVTLALDGSFFTIDRSTFDLDPGASRQVAITALSREAGTYEGAIVPSGLGVPAGLRIPVLMLVTAPPSSGNPLGQPQENRIDLGAPSDQDLVDGSVVFTNTGDAVLTGVVVADVPWLLITEPFVTIQPGASATIAFVIDRRLRSDAADPFGSAVGTLSLQYFAARGAATATGDVRALDGTTGATTTLVTVTDTAKPKTSVGAPSALGAGEVALFVSSLGHVQTGAGTFISDVYMASRASVTNVSMYYTAAGQSLASTVGATLGSLTTLRPVAFSDLTKTVFAHDNGLGTLQVRGTNIEKLAISASVVNKSNRAGTYGSAIPVLRSDRAVAGSGSMYIPGLLARSAASRTNLTLQEVSGTDATVLVDLLDQNGVVVETKEGVVPAFQHIRMNDFAPPGATAARIRLKGGSQGSITAYATPFDLLSGDTWVVTDWPLVEGFDPSARQIIPIAGKLEGANQNYFRSTAAIVNQSAVPATLLARFVANTGIVVEKSIQVAAGGTVAWNDMIGELFGTAGLGYVEIDPQGTPVAITSRTFATIGDDPKTFGTGVPAVAAASLGAGESVRISGFDDADVATITAKTPATFRTNLGLVETSGKGATVRVTIHYRHPVSTTLTMTGSASRDFPVGPGQFLLLQGVAAQVLGDFRSSLKGNLKELFADVEVVSGEGEVIAFTSSIDNGTGDQLFKLQ